MEEVYPHFLSLESSCINKKFIIFKLGQRMILQKEQNKWKEGNGESKIDEIDEDHFRKLRIENA